jgi:hypothetical protein
LVYVVVAAEFLERLPAVSRFEHGLDVANPRRVIESDVARSKGTARGTSKWCSDRADEGGALHRRSFRDSLPTRHAARRRRLIREAHGFCRGKFLPDRPDPALTRTLLRYQSEQY